MIPTTEPTPLRLRRELQRKAIHLIAIGFPVTYAVGVSRLVLTVVLGALSVIALSVEIARWHSDRARQAFMRATGPLLRPHEQYRLSGATWLMLALLGVVVLFPRDVAIVAMWAVVVGDALAALFGRAFGRQLRRQLRRQ